MWQTPLERLCADGHGEGGKRTVGWWLPALNTADFEGNVTKRTVRCDQFGAQYSRIFIMRGFAFTHWRIIQGFEFNAKTSHLYQRDIYADI